MADLFNKQVRKKIMSSIKSVRTKPELKLKKSIMGLGFSYQPKKIIGKPDFFNKKSKVAIFVNGCFWHGCPKHFKMPKSNISYWKEKINKNMERDKNNMQMLKFNGVKVIYFWEHEINKDIQLCVKKLSELI